MSASTFSIQNILAMGFSDDSGTACMRVVIHFFFFLVDRRSAVIGGLVRFKVAAMFAEMNFE
jgi:hypothetical protein